MSSIVLFLGIAMMYATPLIFGALGGVLSECSGVVNIGIEGMMTIGAATAVCTTYFTGSPWLGFLCAGLAGGALAFLHALASVTFQADQTISGLAINLLGSGISLFMCSYFFEGATHTPAVPKKLPKLFGQAATGWKKALNLDVTVLLALLCMLALWIVFYHTKLGLRIRAVGEHPRAADTLGISVAKIRYGCVLTSGILSGFGGAAVTLAIISQFSPTAISGQGFIALAAVIFGKWKPHGVYGACLLFGAAQALAILMGGGTSIIPSQIIAMIPYGLTIFILLFFVGRSVAPKAAGVPYEKGGR